MPVVTFLPRDIAVIVTKGDTLLEAAQRGGISVPASCGGKGLCGKCRVRVVEGDAPPSRGCEHALSPAEIAQGWRLACLVPVQGDLVVETPHDAAVRNVVLTEFGGRDALLEPTITAHPLAMERPSLEDQKCDLGRIARALHMDGYPRCPVALLQALPRRLRELDFRITAVTDGDELIGVDPYAENPRVYGVAFDIGTTTIAGALFDLATGEALGVGARTNPQAVRGDDVISRIEHARTGRDERRELQRLVVEALQEIVLEVCDLARVDTELVYCIAAAGNTTMHHLLLGLDPTWIAETPFIAGVLRGIHVRAEEIGFGTARRAQFYALPNISAYVGGDIVAGMLAQEVHESQKPVLLLDVGTNGEMALRANGETIACSTAAGPAFEGARISCGMRASTGAINSVRLGADGLEVRTVDDAPARGICGTGLLDALAAMLDAGVLDETGRLLDPDEIEDELPDLPPAIVARVQEDENGPLFVLAEGNGAPRVSLTQKDVREFQLSKGAVAAGVMVMLDQAGLEPAALDTIHLAGAFGSYLRPESALRVGLLPSSIPPRKVRAVGNAALAGARLCLLSRGMLEKAEAISHQTRYLELSGRADFQDAFVEAMEFPEPTVC